MRKLRPIHLKRRYTKDGVSLYARGKLIERFRGVYAIESAMNFEIGWNEGQAARIAEGNRHV